MGSLFRGGGTTTTTTGIPDWAEAQVRDNFGLANQIAARPYQPYSGGRVAGLSPYFARADQQVQNLGGTTAMGTAEQFATQAGQAETPMVGAGSINAGLLRDVNVGQYMSPYTQSVIDASINDINQQAGRQSAAVNARAAARGAFGARRDVAQGLVDEAATNAVARTSAGLRDAGFGRAQDAATADINRVLQTNLANLQAGQTAALANQQAGMQGNATRLNAAGALANIGAGQQGMGLRNLEALLGLNRIQQGQEQAGLDTAYADWVAQQNFPLQGLQIRQGVLAGAPLPQTTTTPYFTNRGGNALSGALGGAVLGNATGFGSGVGAGAGALLGLLG